MELPKNAQKELAALRASLSRAVESADPQEWPKIVRSTIRRIDTVIERLDQAPAQIGKKGGGRLGRRGDRRPPSVGQSTSGRSRRCARPELADAPRNPPHSSKPRSSPDRMGV